MQRELTHPEHGSGPGEAAAALRSGREQARE
jgi:hypothetical protein